MYDEDCAATGPSRIESGVDRTTSGAPSRHSGSGWGQMSASLVFSSGPTAADCRPAVPSVDSDPGPQPHEQQIRGR